MPLGSNIPITHRTLSPMPNKQSSIRNAIGAAQRSFQNLSGLFAGKVLRVDAANNCCDIELITGGILHEVVILQSAAGTIDGVYAVPKIRPPKSNKKTETEDREKEEEQAGHSFASSDAALEEQRRASEETSGTLEETAEETEKEADDDDVDSPDGRIPWKDIEDADYSKPENKRDTWAICGYLLDSANTPVVVGFVFPHSTQMSIKQDQKNKKDRIDYLRRLPGRQYEVHLRGGTYEFNFSDGSHIRVGHPKEEEDDDSSDDEQQEPSPNQNPNLPPPGALAVTAPVDTPGTPPDPSNQGLQQPPGESEDDYYDDAAGDPDGRIKLGQGQYENLDKKDKPWKIKKDPKKRRMFLVHSTKAKLGICEHGAMHIQNYLDVDQESSPPEGYTDLDGGSARLQQISTGDLDAHQRRLWRARWGDQATPPGEDTKLVVGEHWFDPQERRDRYWLKAPSDGGGAGSLNDPSWQNAPETHADENGTGVVGEEGQGDPDGTPANRGAEPGPDGLAKPAEVKLNAHGFYADAMVGGRQADSKWAGNNGADVFLPPNSPFKAPTNGTTHYFSGPSGSPLNPGGLQYSMDFTMTSGPDAGKTIRLTHIAAGGTDGTVSAGDTIATAYDKGLGDPNGPGGCNWQHFDVAISSTGTFSDGSPTNSGDINAPQWLKDNEFNLSTTPGQTGGPDQLMAGGCPFDGAGGEGSAGEGSKQEAKRQWYMPAAVPAGGGVKDKVQPIGEKCLDSKAAEDGGRGIIDAAAADHVHCIKGAEDEDMQASGEEGSAGSQSSGVAWGNHVHPGGGGMAMAMNMQQSLLDKIQELEQRLAVVENR